MKSFRLISRSLRPSSLRPITRITLISAARIGVPATQRSLSTTQYRSRGLSPDSTDPKPPNPESSPSHAAEPAALSDSEYHEIADQYLNNLVLALEEKAESSEGLEVEYSAGVLTISQSKGTYVINKQPPNKQIWLSSPISGPKRFDWVIRGAGQHEKEDSEYGAGDDGEWGRWVYLRDGSSLSELLEKEVGVQAAPAGESDAAAGREGPRGGGEVE